ncbi:MAG: T9SS type A sorting domain-containing protein [Ignavibacteriae bacterium]|nr:T9SS type A sorting domain-containing protein [Ignavibacteriota bacterium]
MKKKIKYLPLLLLFALFSYIVVANIMTWHVLTLQQIQTVSNDSLQYGKDWSPRIGDSVQFTCRVVAPPQVYIGGVYRSLLRGSDSYTCYAQDTASGVFGGIVIRKSGRVTNTNLQYVDTGNIITVKGIVQEFWSASPNTPWPNRSKSGWLTQIALDSSGPITINSIGGSRPVPKLVNINDFAIGDYPNPGGSINYVGGEKYEGMYVEIRNVTVGPGLVSRQPWSIVDGNGNKLYVRDFSNFYSTSPSPSTDTLRPWSHPAQGTIVNYIRGVIINTNSEGVLGNQLPYAIVPIYPNDLSLGGVPPQLSGPNKTPGVPTPADSVSVNVTIQSNTTVTNASVYYRINGGAFVNKQMNLAGGNIYATKLPPTALNNLVEYYFSATNTTGLTRLLPSDTSISKLFYKVKASDSLSIQEVQYCPNNGGHSGYENAIVRGIEGIVTADTIDFKNYSYTSWGGTVSAPPRVIIQNGTGPFSGIWIAGSPSDQLRKGQKVRVSGTVTYSFGINQIMTAVPSDVQILSTGNPLPAPQILTAAVLANYKSGGDTTIKKWESVLVKINTPVWISCINLARGVACTSHETLRDSIFRRNFGEFSVVDYTNTEARIMLPGAGPTYTGGPGHTYYNNWDSLNLPGRTLLTQNDSISFIQGILYYAYSNYKICPRSNSDFGTVTPVGIKHIEGVVEQFKLNQNYPNPFNPVTRIGFNLPMYSKVEVRVYDVLGRQVQTLVNENMNAGSFLIDFNGSDFASGVYFVRMTAIGKDGTNFADTKKMLLIK